MTDPTFTPEKSFHIDDVLAQSKEIAAGGACAISVLELLHTVENKVTDRDRVVVDSPIGLHDQFSESIDELAPHTATLLAKDGADSYMVATSTGEPGSKQQDIYYVRQMQDKSQRGFKLWTLREKKFVEGANDIAGECSEAFFQPAIDLGDWDFSMVVGKDDESKPTSLDASIENPDDASLTRKSVVDKLASVIRAGYIIGSLKTAIKLDELCSAYLPTIDAPVDPITTQIYHPLGKAMLDTLEWAGLAGTMAELETDIPLGDQRLLRLVPFPSRQHSGFIIKSVFNDLGTSPRIDRIGSVTASDVSQPPLALTNAGSQLEGVLEHVETMLDVPEIHQASDELKKEIYQLIHGESYIKKAVDKSFAIEERIRNYRNENSLPHNSYLDIGELDIRGVGAGSFFEETEFVVATIHANKDQDVYTNSSFVYGSTVTGASRAFCNTRKVKDDWGPMKSQIRRSQAIDCDQAFCSEAVRENYRGSHKLEDTPSRAGVAVNCVADSCPESFIRLDSAIGCIAGDGEQAFINCGVVNGSISKHTPRAFLNFNDEGFEFTGNTAEFANEAFNLHNRGKNIALKNNIFRYSATYAPKAFMRRTSRLGEDGSSQWPVVYDGKRGGNNRTEGSLTGPIKAFRRRKRHIK